MKQHGFDYEIKADLTFTKEEVAFLSEEARSHYDLTCRSAARQGGFLYGINNTFEDYAPDLQGRGSLTFRQVDTLVKILEQSSVGAKSDAERKLARDLDEGLRAALKSINERSKALLAVGACELKFSEERSRA